MLCGRKVGDLRDRWRADGGDGGAMYARFLIRSTDLMADKIREDLAGENWHYGYKHEQSKEESRQS